MKFIPNENRIDEMISLFECCIYLFQEECTSKIKTFEIKTNGNKIRIIIKSSKITMTICLSQIYFWYLSHTTSIENRMQRGKMKYVQIKKNIVKDVVVGNEKIKCLFDLITKYSCEDLLTFILIDLKMIFNGLLIPQILKKPFINEILNEMF